MNITLSKPANLSEFDSLPSKAEAHRALIAASLADGKTEIVCKRVNDDMLYTMGCLNALGADIKHHGGGFTVCPIKKVPEFAVLDCGMSGSTLRFMLPVAASLCNRVEFVLHGRLAQRPLSPLADEMKKHGCTVSCGSRVLSSGIMRGGKFSLTGSVSSQFASGLLMAGALTGIELTLDGNIQSRPYIDMTVGILNNFGAEITSSGGIFTASKKSTLVSPGIFTVGGDYSDAAFFLCAGIVGSKPVTVKGLDPGSYQGDRAVIDILKMHGGDIKEENGNITAYPSELKGGNIDLADIPDLAPPLAVAFASGEGRTVFTSTARLRYKESDRVLAICSMLNELGIKTCSDEDSITVFPGKISGGTVDSFGDHRIAMAAAVAAIAAEGDITVCGAECVSKSHPLFFKDMFGIEV